MMTNFDRTTHLLLAASLCLAATACDQVEDGQDADDVGFRSLKGVGTGPSLTMNTNQWVSSSARDVFEFALAGNPHTNSYGYETKLATIMLPNTPFGPVETEIGVPPMPGEPKAAIRPGDDFGVKVEKPGQPAIYLEGTDLIGLELSFDVNKGMGEPDHAVTIRFVDHLEEEGTGDFYGIVKIDPITGEDVAPLCEEDANGYRLARIFDGLSVHGETGEMTFIGQSVHHIACSASAPAKSLLFGYDPAQLTVQSYTLANRVVRADYCADGHPYTYPGNLVGIDDNFRSGNEGKTIADVYASLGADEVVEAVWDEHGILCIDTPRASNVDRPDVVCPVKELEDGSVAFNWQPPSCQGFVDPNPNAMRFFSTASL